MSRFLFTDLASGNITATSTDANYPIANLSDYNPKSVWKSVTNGATLTITIADIWLMDVALFNCNKLTSITYRIYNGAALQESGTLESDVKGNFWKNAGDDGPSTSMQIDINTTTKVAELGILRVGYSLITKSPQNWQVGYDDLSLSDRTRNQAINIRQKERLWTVSGNIASQVNQVTSDASLLEEAKDASPYPLAVKLLDSTFKKFLFGQLAVSQAGPLGYDGGVETYHAYAMCDFDMTEVL
jgi:hypothetical protein